MELRQTTLSAFHFSKKNVSLTIPLIIFQGGTPVMPYLQIFLEQGLDEKEAQLALAYVRDHFPLRQSEGRLYRMASHFLLFEQPEHGVLTFEQELWLEQHTKEAHIWHTSFYQGEDQACRLCRHPFDDSPTGYCPQCHSADPYQTMILKLPLTEEEDAYLTHLARSVWGETEGPYLRRIIQTFLDLLDAGYITLDAVLVPGQTRFEEKARALFQKQQTTCSLCGLPDEQCTCIHSTFAHNYRQFAALFEREYFVTIPLSHQDARRLQELAGQHGMSVDSLVRALIEIPDIQIAAASREAAAGHALSIDFAFQLTRIAEQTAQWFLENSPIQAIRDVAGNTFSPSLFHVAGLGASIAGAFPLLEAHVPSLLLDRQQNEKKNATLAWVKEQLAAHDAVSVQKAQPCTLDEIAELEALAGWSFPAAYRAFLAWMGHGAGAFLQYLTCFYPALPGLQTAARELLDVDSCQEHLPRDAWVMALLTGQHFTFFRLSEGDDPPVYAYRSEWRRTPFCKIAHHLSDFLRIQIALYAEYRQHGAVQSSLGRGHRQLFLAMAPRIEAAMANQQKQ
jgi:hypothetical protein